MINSVFLKIHGFDFEVDFINRLLGVEPTRYWVRGDLILGAKAEFTRKESYWEFASNISKESHLSKHIESMIKFIDSVSNPLKIILHECEGEFTIYSKCNKLDEFNFGTYFDKGSLRILSEVGLNLDIDIYFLPRQS